MQGRRLDRRGQILRIGLEGIDHVNVAAQGGEHLLVGFRGGLVDHAHVRVQEPGGHRDLEVDLLIVGERHHRLALGPHEPGLDQVIRDPGVGLQSWHGNLVVPEIERLDPFRVLVQDHRRHAGIAQAPSQDAAGAAEAANDEEGLG